MLTQFDTNFLDSYFENISFIWWEFENKRIGMTEREELLAPYRKKLHEILIKQGNLKNVNT